MRIMKRFTEKENQVWNLKKATMVNAVSKFSIIIWNLFFSAILARLLNPSDYGVVAIITVFTNFFILFADMGIGPAIIQKKELQDVDIDRIFTFTLFLGVGLAFVFSCLSFAFVKIYDNTVYYSVGPLLGLNLALSSFNMVPQAVLMRKKLFISNGVRNIVATIFSSLVALVIAFMGGKYYAIVIQNLISSIVILLWNLLTTKVHLNFKQILKSVRLIWGYSSFQFAFGLINYFSRNLDNLLTGYYFGNAALGYYDKSYRLMRYPVENLTAVITPSMQPILSDYQNNIKYVEIQYVKIVKFLSTVGVFIGAICFCASREVIILYFGSQWEKSVTSFHILSAVLPFQMVVGVSGSIYQSVNKTKQMFLSGLGGAIITISSIVVGIILGSINSLALCYAVGFLLNFIQSQFFLALTCFKVRVWNLFKIFIPEFLIFCMMVIAMSFLPNIDNLFWSLVFKLLVGILVYIVMMTVTKNWKYLLVVLPTRLKEKLSQSKFRFLLQ